jgi:multiple sugar transport system substrate-binding protein
MKKKLLAVLLSVTMVATMFVGCGNKNNDSKESTTTTEGTKDNNTTDDANADTETVDQTAEGKVFNIYCWNDEFQRRVKAHYPGYTEVDATTGKIGDVTVKWNITPSDDNAYQNNLDETLLKQKDAAQDDKIDLFLIEADYALKYVDTEYTMPVSKLGVTETDLSKQYQYTKDIVTDSKGQIKGVSWQGCPGVLIYRRSIAKDVFGTDEVDKIQEKLSDWDKFTAAAKEVKDKGYYMLSGYDDAYRVFSNNVTSKWVVDGKINIDANIKNWVDQTKDFTDKGYNNKTSLWSSDWSTGFTPEGKDFCYFGPAWFVDFTLGGHGTDGDWYATKGPQGFFWGGTWICGATGTDNQSLIKDIMLKLATDDTIMKDIVVDDNDFVNNTTVMDAMSADTTYKSKVLGDSNPLGTYADGAGSIDLSNISSYDQGCTEEFQGAMKDYFDGNATYDEALQNFYSAITVKYPELSY